MGDSLPVIRETSIMKLAIVVCLAAYVAADATADADADPALLYTTYGPHALTGYASYLPLTTYASPYTYGYAPRYYANSSGAVHIVKRDAEPDAEPAADADADAALYGYAYRGYLPYAYSGYRYPYAYSGYRYPYHHYGKRSADAEPVADATADVDADAALYGYTYGAYHPYAYSAYGYNRYPYAYSAFPYYHHFGKRSADAEAHHGYGYRGYGYYRPHGYYGYYRG